MPDQTHADLCNIAARWMQKPFRLQGHGCQVAFTETRTGYLSGETPDAIGFRVSTHRDGGGSTVVECKISRADFLHDKKKPHRNLGCGLGRFRYYLCPQNMIEASEVPAGWGLIYVIGRNRIQVIAGATLSISEPGPFDHPHDTFSETLLLANLLHRVGNAAKLNLRLRAADRLNAQLQRRIEIQDKHLDQMRKEYFALGSVPIASTR